VGHQAAVSAAPGRHQMHQTIILRAPLQPSTVRITAVTHVTP
jgi:hypothetical protein